VLGIFVFGDPFFSPCLVGAASERVAWYKKCPGDRGQCFQERVPPGPPSLLLSKPGSRNKGEGGIGCLELGKETDLGGVGSRISATARLSTGGLEGIEGSRSGAGS
jgi:hypothetical protein